ncbi:hypothetical protein ACFLWY_00090 [Chloroflexota bacterium]
MIEQIDTTKYKKAWRKAERKSIVSRFRTMGWGLEKNNSPEDEAFKKSDFIDAFKKASRRVKEHEASQK